MPALPPQPQTLKIRYRWTVGADIDASTTVHYTYTGTAPSNATCATMASDIYANAVTNYGSLFSTAVLLTGVDVTDLTSATSGNGAFVGSTAGTRSGAPLSAETCFLNGLLINRRYRGGKPRTYWPWGVAGDLATPSAWSSTFISNCFTGLVAHNNYILALVVAGTAVANQVSISQYHGFLAVQNPITGRWRNVPTVRSVAIAPDLIAGYALNSKPGSQRRRQQHST